ncbi:MAG: glycogen-binding domain-containing protein [Gemmatimonadota bacterium]|nr:glycogen-binding domain-containing protein [Gemmatimonadota bacterium]
MNERIHACLDGEITRDDLSPAERAQMAELEEALRSTTEHLRSLRAPDLTARVMAALPREAVAAPAAERAAPWCAALDWLWKPRSLQLSFRPAYAFAAALLVAVGLPRLDGGGSGTPGAPAKIPAQMASAPAKAPPVYVQFRLEVPDAEQVAVAGTFTGWKPAYQLQETEPGVWSALIPLKPGVHDYAFVVDGEEWVPDPHAPHVADSFGGTNSRISLPPPESA